MGIQTNNNNIPFFHCNYLIAADYITGQFFQYFLSLHKLLWNNSDHQLAAPIQYWLYLNYEEILWFLHSHNHIFIILFHGFIEIISLLFEVCQFLYITCHKNLVFWFTLKINLFLLHWAYILLHLSLFLFLFFQLLLELFKILNQ